MKYYQYEKFYWVRHKPKPNTVYSTYTIYIRGIKVLTYHQCTSDRKLSNAVANKVIKSLYLNSTSTDSDKLILDIFNKNRILKTLQIEWSNINILLIVDYVNIDFIHLFRIP